MPLLIFKSNGDDPKQSELKAQEVSISFLIPASKIEHWQSADCHYYGRNFADIDINDMLSVIASELFKENVILIRIGDGMKVSDKAIQSFGEKLLGYCHREIAEVEIVEFCHFLMRESRWENARDKLTDVDHYHSDLTDGGVSYEKADEFLAQYQHAIRPLLLWLDEQHCVRQASYAAFRRDAIELLNAKVTG